MTVHLIARPIVAGTGHRPDKLGGYGDLARDTLVDFAIEELALLKPRIVISGMALGWDQALATAALELDIRFWAYLPFEGQEAKWPENAKRRFEKLLNHADKMVVVSSGSYEPWKMQARNERMVDDCTVLSALYNGDKEGGTYNCVTYAEKQKRTINNCWQRWLDFNAQNAA